MNILIKSICRARDGQKKSRIQCPRWYGHSFIIGNSAFSVRCEVSLLEMQRAIPIMFTLPRYINPFLLFSKSWSQEVLKAAYRIPNHSSSACMFSRYKQENIMGVNHSLLAVFRVRYSISFQVTSFFFSFIKSPVATVKLCSACAVLVLVS
jgi:hypothetical protein